MNAKEATTVKQLATEMYKAFRLVERDNGDKIYVITDRPEWMTDVIRTAHGESFPDDTIYEFIYDAVQTLSDVSDGDSDEDTLREAIYEIEADIYTSDLTAWLHRRPDHVYYLTQALEDFGPITDGFALLSTAQKIQRDEVGEAVLNALLKLA